MRAGLVVAAYAATLGVAAPVHGAAGFGDVAEGRFYSAAVQWMVDEELTLETTTGCFLPEQPASRAEVAVFLHRFAGAPEGGAEPFRDVNPDDLYAEAVAWLYEAKITLGTGPETFSPHRPVTRAEFATFLHRFAGEPDGVLTPFSDVGLGSWFSEPVAWMFATGITKGTSTVTFSPYRSVTRAEVATMLYRFQGAPAVELDANGVCGNHPRPSTLLAEAESFVLLNGLRTSRGLAELERDPLMDAYARNWSREMHDRAGVQHSAGPYGENVAWWSLSEAAPELVALRLHSLWLGSDSHYANMTDDGFSSVGIGFWNGPGGWYVTQVFSAS